jgi:hypothetical protein
MKKIFLIISMFTFSQTVLAEITCPSISTIISIKFSSAKKIPWIAGPNGSGLWMVTSDQFTDQGETWNLMYNVTTSATNETQAIQHGTTLLNQKQLIQPIKTVESKRNVCTYTSNDDVDTVSAFNPPLGDKVSKTQEENVNPTPVKDIQGNWFHNKAQTLIKSDQSSYTLCNEDGNCASGFWRNGNIQVPQWHVTGTLSNDGNSIAWSNGTRWQRK